MKEVWRDYPMDLNYKVSNLGNVRSIDKISANGKLWKGRVLKVHLMRNGYLAVNLRGKPRTIHQLLAETFLGYIRTGVCGGLCVDHIDNVKTNNSLNNLRIIDWRENLSKDRKPRTSKYIGVWWRKNRNRWVSKIRENGKQIHLGSFVNELDASEAYQSALRKIKTTKK